MAARTVRDIVIPFVEGTPLVPAVGLSTRIVIALSIMTDIDVERIAVIENGRAIGIVRIEDSLRAMGLA